MKPIICVLAICGLSLLVPACDSAPCGGKTPPTECSSIANTWSGTWRVTSNPGSGSSGSWQVTIDGSNCNITGTLTFFGERATVAGQMCSLTTGELTLSSNFGSGSAALTLNGNDADGTFSVSVTNSPSPFVKNGSYSGTFSGDAK